MNQKIHLITGKGGVGKSTLASVLAMDLAKDGQRVLLVELGAVSEFSQLFQTPIGFHPTEIQANLYVSRWTGFECLKEFLIRYLRLSKVVELFFNNKVMGPFLKAAPALNELSILGKITSGIRGIGSPLEYDEIIVDTYSTGHFKALINAPRGMRKVVSQGPMGRESESISRVVSDATVCSVYVVSINEEMSMVEAIETCQDCKREWGIEAKAILNKVYPDVRVPMDGMKLEALSERQKAFLDYVREQIRLQEKALKWFQGEGFQVLTSPLSFGESGLEKIQNLMGRVLWTH